MNSADIYFFLKENDLNDSRIEKLYHKNGEVILRLYKKNKFILNISKNKIMILKNFSSDSEQPDTFTMTLRKHIKGKINISQKDFDRLLEIKSSDGILICEMFRNGNFIICDNNHKIIVPEERQEWRTRKIKSGEIYAYPPSENILSREIFEEKIKNSNKGVASFLGSHGFGIYSEEICLMSKIEKDKKCSELSNEEMEKLFESIKMFLNREMKPNIIMKDGKVYDFSPVELEIYHDYEKKYYEKFNDVLNVVFSKVKKEKKSKENRIQDMRKEKIKKYEEMETEFINIAEYIQESSDYIQFFLNSSKDKIKGMEKIKIDINGKKIDLDLRKSIMKNASLYFERAKQMKKKIEKIKSLIENEEKTQKKKNENEKKEVSKIEKFRTFKTSDGFTVLAGKDADTNEFLVKKRMEKSDIIFHADIIGAPFTLIKTNGKRPSPFAIKEAAQFAACYSRAWRRKLGTVDVYWIRPNQVKKVPGLPKGSFQIQGKRNYLRNVELKLYFEPVKGKIELLPYKIDRIDDKVIELTPGNEKGNKIMEIVKKKFKGYQISSDLKNKIPFNMGEVNQ